MGLISFFRDRRLERAAREERAAGVALTLSQMALGARTLGGMSVSPLSMLGVAAIFAAIRIRGESLANMPLRITRKVGREKKVSPLEDLRRLLQDSPDGQITATQFLQTLESNSCLTGCAYAYIERNIYGEPLRILPLPSYEVSYWTRDWNEPTQYLEYNVRGQRVPSSDLIIIPFGQVYPYWQTLRPSDVLSKPIALAQALDYEAYNLFKNGCNMSGVLQTDGKLTETALARVKEYLTEFATGGKRSGSLMVLEEGLKYAAARMTNKDAEFVELKKQAIRDASAVWGVPSFQLGDGEKANYSSQEEQNRYFLYTTMMSRAKLIANELNNKLLTPANRAAGDFIDFDLRGILGGSMKDRAEYYTKLFNMGAITIDTIDEMEDLPLVGGEMGQMRFVQLNMQTLEQFAKAASAPAIETEVAQ